jgi:glycosyltransferase involved in cell wall biosynthesis
MMSHETPPLISIIVAVYNGAKTLQQCIDSGAQQTYSNKELIIIDGGSTDGSVEILQKNSDTINCWKSQKDRGIAHAWNKALKHATGDWVLFLGADDRLHDIDVLSDLAEILSKDFDSDIIYGRIIFEGGKRHGQVYGHHCDIRELRRKMVIPHTAAFHRRTFFDEVGQFDETFEMAMDYEILLRKKQLSVRHINRHIAVMGGEGVSSTLVKKGLTEWRMAQLKNKVDWRLKIEAWHAFYQLRHQFNLWRTKGVAA